MTSSSHVTTECQIACKFTGKPPKYLLEIVQIHKGQVYFLQSRKWEEYWKFLPAPFRLLPFCFETKGKSNKAPLKCVGTKTTWNKPIITYLNQPETRKIESIQSQKKNCTSAATLYTTAVNTILKIFFLKNQVVSKANSVPFSGSLSSF